MNTNNAVVNRQALALFNFWLKKRQNDKCIGDLTIGDFVEMCRFLAEIKHENTKDQNCSNKNQKRKETQMQIINDNFKEILSNGEPRSVLDEECQTLGIPNIPEYVDAIEAYGEKRILMLSVAGTHFLTDKRLAELKDGERKKKVKRFKRFINETMGKRGELKMFNNKAGE
jgi:hypothetical protein